MNCRILMVLAIIVFLFTGNLEGRKIENFNENWKFIKGNPAGAKLLNFNDSLWRNISLPHDWAIYGPFDSLADGATGKLPWRGEGWYRKKFNLNPMDTGKRIYFLFDGIMAFPKVYVKVKVLLGSTLSG